MLQSKKKDITNKPILEKKINYEKYGSDSKEGRKRKR